MTENKVKYSAAQRFLAGIILTWLIYITIVVSETFIMRRFNDLWLNSIILRLVGVGSIFMGLMFVWLMSD